MPKAAAFIIHLKRAKQRFANVQDIKSALPLPAEIADAVDGSLIPEKEVQRFYPKKDILSPKYPFEMAAGELGCFKSHIQIWQEIVSRKLDYALVVEDDIKLDPKRFKQAFDLALGFLGQHGFIQFQTRPNKGKGNRWIGLKGEIEIYQNLIIPRRTSAQLVSYNAAKELLRFSDRIDRPVDGMLQLYWETGVRPLSIFNGGISDLTQALGGSTISRKSPTSTAATREWKRLLYRWAIYRYSKRHNG